MAGAVCLVAGLAIASPRVNTTKNDFYFFGTQPQNNIFDGGTLAPLVEPQYCAGCHQDYSGETPNSYTIPYDRWRYSLMANSYRDPIFHAQFQIAEADAGESGFACLKCHTPIGWIENRAVPTDGSALSATDKVGVACIVCHRMVNPEEQSGPSPLAGSSSVTPTTDREILEALGVDRPPNFANGGPVAANSYVIDPQDRRRGPFAVNIPYHEWAQSQFHTTSALCASCHDISNPVFVKQGDGSYALTPLNQPHPTGNKYDMYPMDRTYSEWLASAFAQGPVTQVVANPNPSQSGTVGRFSFDGVTRDTLTNDIVIYNGLTGFSSCQDCHQPPAQGQGCELAPPVRSNIPVHSFAGGNTWVLRSSYDMYGFDSLMDNPVEVDNAVDRNKNMLKAATDVSATVDPTGLTVRVTNESGHKFPGGFSEGRRAWVNVRFLDADNQLIAERGAYNFTTAVLDDSSTKVYQSKHGLDNAMALIAGLPPGPSFHIDLNNKHYFDNRIPPRGFTNAGFEAVQAAPVGYTYADGQHWDDTAYAVPAGAARAEVRVYFQTTDRDYIEFIRDNATQPSIALPQPVYVDPDTGETITRWELPAGYTPSNPLTSLSAGEIAYAQWLKWGKSQPVEVDYLLVELNAAPVGCALADVNADGTIDGTDFVLFINSFAIGDTGVDPVADVNLDGTIDGNDFVAFINSFAIGC